MPQRGTAPSGEHRIGDWLIAGADDWEPRRSRRAERRRARDDSASIDQLWADADLATPEPARNGTGVTTLERARTGAGVATRGQARAGAGVATLDPPRTAASRQTPVGVQDPAGANSSAGAPGTAAAPAPADASGAGVPGRRTVTIRGRGAERYVPTRPAGTRRPTRRRYERAGFRPDRAAMWAVLLGVMLILVAVTSAHAAILH